ncbi:PfkB family carbohydrate kinase [Massilia cavernae]|uniref:Carbohydrate kinase n=1 Tax=Massilia cavernae TaxID=2320864 RepID=A0A418XPT8_9BURK|nr:PfkB family carbohydrate kinase [Massilia cavernae]RJG14445.1 carbohydrate kinase [Massilia cavernae]
MVVTFGEALVDLIEQHNGRFAAVLGGSVCNFTLAVARQGMAVTYLNPLSQDSFGQRFADYLADAGVHLASTARSAKPTSLAVVTLDAQKMPTYSFHRAAVADRDISPAQACAALPPGLALFHTGGLALVPDDIAATLQVIEAAAGAGALVSVDANMRPMVCPDLPAYAAGVRTALALANIIKVSEEDLVHLGFGDLAPVDAARALFDAPAVKLVALTLGEQGGVLISRQASVQLGIPAGVDVVDTVGAGDCFLAGLVASLHRAGKLTLDGLANLDQATLEHALEFAIATASLNVMEEGCSPPTSDEVKEYLDRGARRVDDLSMFMCSDRDLI